MQRLTVLAASLGLVGASLGVAQANEPPPHGHLLVTGIQFDADGEPIGYKHCRLLAAGRPVPLNAHHAHIHTGKAGEMLFTRARAAAVPLAPLTPWSTCEEFAAMAFD